MKLFLLATIFAFVLSGCTNRSAELEQQNKELQTRNSELGNDLAARDRYVDEVTQSINDIYGMIEGSRAREKQILLEADKLEGGKKTTTTVEARQRLLSQIALIDSNLKDNRQRISTLEAKLKSARTQYAGLKKMVENLKETLAEREAAIAQLQSRVTELENEVGEKTKLVAAQESTIHDQQSRIEEQTNRINTAYYVIGKRSDLEKKGIIRDEGGFLWGLFGSTTVLASGIDRHNFTPIDKLSARNIEVQGNVSEIIPRRNQQYYRQSKQGKDLSTLEIVEPDGFWQDNYLVIITD